MADESPASKIKVLNARIVIDAPPVYVWQTITSYGKFKEFLPGYEKTDVVSADPHGKVVDVAMSVTRLLPTYKYRVRVNENRQSFELKMNRISGDFKYLTAVYQLYPKNNGAQTVLSYCIKVDPGFTLPTLGLSPILKNNTEKTLKAIENRSIQEHRKSLIGQR
jgi:ribosome-associated toxin RatA of RatAB toxin-antitoxin module